MDFEDDQSLSDASLLSSWDVATRYHDFKTSKKIKKNDKLSHYLKKISSDAILSKAREILGSIVKPVDSLTLPYSEIPFDAHNIDFDLDETLENSPLFNHSKNKTSANDLYASFVKPKTQGVVICVDTSLSMTGEKLALTAVAIAVVLLQFPDDPIGIIAFENEARVLKYPDETLSIHQLIERFLDVPAQGYTHLEQGMKSALKLISHPRMKQSRKPPATVLLTDGKYTAGRDPAYLASHFPQLTVLKMGNERASKNLCLEMAQRGSGVLREVKELDQLPQSMYSIVKSIISGNANSLK